MKSILRNTKELVSKNHLSLLSQIADNEKEIKEHGLPYHYLRLATLMKDNGLISEADLQNIADNLLVMEKTRIINLCLQRIADKAEVDLKKQGVDIEELYQRCGMYSELQDDDFVDTSLLFVGMVVKDYQTMCSLVGESTTTGAAKTKQMKNWSRYFDFEKVRYKNSFVILEIYDEPISKTEKKYRNSAFINEMKVLILKEVSKQDANAKGNIIYLTSFSRLIRKLHITNRFFYEDTFSFFLAKHSDLFSEDNISWNYQIFRSNAFRKIKDSVKYTLDALAKDDMLQVSGYYAIGEKCEDGTVVYHNATDNEVAYITAAKKLIANKMGFRNSMDASLFNQADFNRLLTAYYKAEYGWDIVYYQLKLIANKENIGKHIHEYTALPDEHSVFELSMSDVNDYRQKYNSNLSCELKKQAENMQSTKRKSYIKRLQESKDFSGMDAETIEALIKADDEPQLLKWGGNFPKIQALLIDYLVDMNPERIKNLGSFLRDIQKQTENVIDTESDDWIPELDFME